MPAAEPRFFRIAAVMADPTRSRMLATLLGGEHRSAGELARVAGVTAQAASTQLAQLVDSGLVTVRSHRLGCRQNWHHAYLPHPHF